MGRLLRLAEYAKYLLTGDEFQKSLAQIELDEKADEPVRSARRNGLVGRVRQDCQWRNPLARTAG